MDAKIYVDSDDIEEFVAKYKSELKASKELVIAEKDSYQIRMSMTKSGFAFSAYLDGAFIEVTTADTFNDAALCMDIMYASYIDGDYIEDKVDERQAEEDAAYEKSDAITLAFEDFVETLAIVPYDPDLVPFMLDDVISLLSDVYGVC